MNFGERFALGHVVRKLQVRFLERSPKAPYAIAILPNIFAFRFVQNVTDVRPRVATRFGEGNKIFNQLFEENIILPKRVVGVDHQRIASHRILYPISIFAGFIRNPSV